MGRGPFYYENSPPGYTGNTQLADMRGGYVTLFLRKAFELAAPERVLSITLDLRVDDGCIVWLNGHRVALVNMPDGEPTYSTTALNADQEPYVFSTTFAPSPGMLVKGKNVIAVQAANVSLSGSSDFLFAASVQLEVDDTPPRVESVFPTPGSVVRELTGLEVTFSRAVQGVDAFDLLVNGVPAIRVEMLSPADYAFSFAEPPEGTVTVSWAPDHGITDTTGLAMPFAGDAWTYTLVKTAPPARIVISEFLADNETGVRDRDGTHADWIELRNLGDEPVSLEGWFLTDDAVNPTKWRFPDVAIGAAGYLLIWASAKDRTSPELHTNFKLSNDGEYLALLDAHTNIVDVFAPAYPPQRTDVSFGRDVVDPEIVGYFPKPTPGAPNENSGAGFAPDPVFSIPGGLLATNKLTVEIRAPSGVIYYSTNGVPPSPTTGAIRYAGPITINSSTIFLARVYEDGLLPSKVVAECYQLVSPGLTNFSSNLPLLIIQPVRPSISGESASRTPVFVTAIEPFRGRSTLLGRAAHQGMGGLNIRGQSSRGFPKKPYRLELTDPAGVNQDVPLPGLPADDDWILHGPYSVSYTH
ncbi:MAG: lamin tail domain-containing protein, partial [Verrucomicrobiae bacterium]|nr:lamin tail domain-containing protein [Verrucomicrobiae bacterium]